MSRICYIGKSNKDFTNSKVYKYFGFIGKTPTENNNKYSVAITIYGNKGNMIFFNDDYFHYIDNNFKIITDEDYEQYIRKNKLKKISNKYKKI